MQTKLFDIISTCYSMLKHILLKQKYTYYYRYLSKSILTIFKLNSIFMQYNNVSNFLQRNLPRFSGYPVNF